MKQLCTALTQAGKPCKHVAVPESNYCSVHIPPDLSIDDVLEQIYRLANLGQ